MADNSGGGLTCRAHCGGRGSAAQIAQRQHYMSVLFGQRNGLAERASAPASLPRAITGTVLDVSPHILIIGHHDSEERLVLGPRATAWRAGHCEPSALRAGEPVIARIRPGRHDVADKVWASIGRVTGTIVARDAHGLLVDAGACKPRQPVVISPRAANSVAVRFPQLEPGNVIDVIGMRRGPVLEALVPATAQPAALAAGLSPAPTARKTALAKISGSAVWHEPDQPGDGAADRGVAYPAIDPATGCIEPLMASHAQIVMPYLALGSLLHVRNDCNRTSQVLPVIRCGAVARLFHDRCLACGTSPRGRVADLTMASFVELGGDLELGCFNVTITAQVAR